MSPVSNKIVIDDLRAPQLTEAQRKFLADAERHPPVLTEEAVLNAAVERAELDDFGPDDFRERLRVVLDEVGANSNLTEFLQTTVFNRSVGVVTNRLLALDLLRRHPEIRDQPVEGPIVIAGLPRSGTTHLLGLIATDRRLRSLPYWEAVQPIPLPAERPEPGQVDPRYARAAQGWERLQLVNPMMAPYHPMPPEHIHEDIELQLPDFSSYYWEWLYPAPRWRDYYLSHDQIPHYEFAKTMLQIIQWQNGANRRWVLKCPQHFEQLRAIMTVFPDAFVVFTHRDPIASLQSIVTQIAYVIRTREKTVDPDFYLDYWTDRVARLLSAYVRDVDFVPSNQRFDVLFDEFMRDDIAMVERIYRAAGLSKTDTTRNEFAGYVAEHQRHQFGSIDHNLRRDFGVAPDDLRARFALYLDRVPVASEVD